LLLAVARLVLGLVLSFLQPTAQCQTVSECGECRTLLQESNRSFTSFVLSIVLYGCQTQRLITGKIKKKYWQIHVSECDAEENVCIQRRGDDFTVWSRRICTRHQIMCHTVSHSSASRLFCIQEMLVSDITSETRLSSLTAFLSHSRQLLAALLLDWPRPFFSSISSNHY
jgi:hypothetical protein